jgi:hypothetical protein
MTEELCGLIAEHVADWVRLVELDGTIVYSSPSAGSRLGDVSFPMMERFARMADRVANNQGTKYHPDKELSGLGMLNVVVNIANGGMPLTGALARTATAIEVGGTDDAQARHSRVHRNASHAGL